MKGVFIKTIIEVSAGGVVINRGKRNSVNVLLISRKKEKKSNGKGIWCLPKGKIEDKETYKEAAIREVREETGVEGEIIQKIGKVNYWYYKEQGVRCNKTVHFYMMGISGGRVSSQSYEVEDAKWFYINDALENMAYEGEREIVKKVKRELKS